MCVFKNTILAYMSTDSITQSNTNGHSLNIGSLNTGSVNLNLTV